MRLHRSLMFTFGLAALALGGLGCQPELKSTTTLTVYTASSLVPAMEKIAALYEETAGIQVEVRPGPSGTLAKDIVAGAPADLFVSADERWVRELEESGDLTPKSSRLLVWNRLVYAVPADADSTPVDLLQLMNLPRWAVADPQTAPLGRYTREALIRMAVWDSIEPRCIVAYDARSTLALVERGEVDVAVVYRSDAFNNPKVKIALDVPQGAHEVAVVTAATATGSTHPVEATAFLEFLNGPDVRAILRDLGFEGS